MMSERKKKRFDIQKSLKSGEHAEKVEPPIFFVPPTSALNEEYKTAVVNILIAIYVPRINFLVIISGICHK